MRTLALLCLLFLPPQQPQDTSPKRCTVIEMVTEGVRSDCGNWRPAKTEKIFMPAEVSKRLKVGDTFYFVWKETRWVAEIADTVALVFADRVVIMRASEAETLYAIMPIENEDDLRLHAALTVALGTLPKGEAAPLPNTRERLDWEIRRGVRPPLQKPEPKENY